MPLPLPVLFQISDSAFPTGGFAYSNGLEALARAGRFPTIEALEDCLDAMLHQASGFDLAFLAAAHEAETSNDPVAFTDACLEWDASIWNAGIRAASLRQGRALIDVLCATFPGTGVAGLRLHARSDQERTHYVTAMGSGLAALGASLAQACGLYLHGLARDQVNAAVRLGLTGPKTAQQLQARALERAMARLGDAPVFPRPRDARRSAPLIEAGQGAHVFLYSRLFQN